MSKLGWNISMGFFYDKFLCDVDEKLYSEVILNINDRDVNSIDEFGSGSGQLTRRLPKTAKIRAFDFSEEAIEKARKLVSRNVEFFHINFYKERPNDYKPDIAIACRSLYHKDLGFSIDMLAEHVGQGLVIIVHPKPYLLDYANPKINGFRKFNSVQFFKGSIGRITNYFGHSYNLFEAEEFERIGNLSFNNVSVDSCAYDTHYIIKLQQ